MNKLVITTVLLLAWSGFWTTIVPARASALSASAAGTYTLGPDDTISVQVINFPELSMAPVTIPPDGKLTVPLIGATRVSGMTVDQLARTLKRMWSAYVVSPSVTVSLVQKRHENVLVYGNVQHPSSVEYKSGMRLLQAIAEAGGIDPKGDLSQVTVTHREGAKETVDVADPRAKAGTEQDVVLRPDDLVFVPERHTQVSVLGEVQKPGSYDFHDQMTVLDALTSAGGVAMDTADLAGATIVHAGVESKLDLDSLLRKGLLDDNIKLAPGDRILIPALFSRTYVFGAVAKPGFYRFQTGDRVLDALNGSGGPLPDADLSRVNVLHIDKVKNVATAQTIDLNKFLTGKTNGDMRVNVALAPGDVLYVPQKGHKAGLSEIIGGLGALNIVASSIRLVGL